MNFFSPNTCIIMFLLYLSGMKRDQTRINIEMALRGIHTDKELAELIGITPNKLSARLRGNISMDTLEKIANTFKITVKELLK